MIITYRDDQNKTYMINKHCYKNNYGEKVHNITQLAEVTGYTIYKIQKVIELCNIESKEIRNGCIKVVVYDNYAIKQIKKNMKKYKEIKKPKKQKIPYLDSAFHQFASRNLIKI